MARFIDNTAQPVPGVESGAAATSVTCKYRVELVQSVADLEPYAEAWDALAAAAPAHVHTISHAWIASFFEHLVPADANCRCLLAFDGDELVGVLPFVVSKKYFSVITKSDVCPPTSNQTFASDLVCRCRDAPFVIDAMVGALDRLLPKAWELTFHHVSCCSQVVGCFTRSGNAFLHHVKADGCGNLVRTDGSFETYVRSLRPRFVTNLRRLGRKIERLPGYEVDVLTGTDAAPGHLEDFLRLEASGWKGRGGTAILNDAKDCGFYRAFTRRLYARRWLEWHVLRVGGHAIAAHMAIRAGRVTYLWKIAYDENYGEYAPGNILMLRTIERAFETPDVDELNCLTNSPWNRDWGMERRDYYRVTVWPRRALPFVAGYCRVRSKDVLRRIPGARRIHRGLLRTMASFGQVIRTSNLSD